MNIKSIHKNCYSACYKNKQFFFLPEISYQPVPLRNPILQILAGITRSFSTKISNPLIDAITWPLSFSLKQVGGGKIYFLEDSDSFWYHITLSQMWPNFVSKNIDFYY